MAVFVICSSLPLFCQSVVTLHLLSFDFPTVNVSSHLKLNCWPYQCQLGLFCSVLHVKRFVTINENVKKKRQKNNCSYMIYSKIAATDAANQRFDLNRHLKAEEIIGRLLISKWPANHSSCLFHNQLFCCLRTRWQTTTALIIFKMTD